MSQAASHRTEHADSRVVSGSRVVADDSRVELKEVYSPVVEELKAVEEILRSELQSDTPFVDSLLQHSWLLGGKRIRPVLLLLAAGSIGEIRQAHLQLAAALEMLHTATLIHDDVLDQASVRRHRETVNAKWGDKVSILLGDYLFTHSFHVASLGNCATSLRYLARASNRVCEGEMRQNAWQGNFDLNQADYMQMITEKTAELCGVACRIGAHLSQANQTTVDQFESYGRNLGVAFQIIDDVLDIVGQPGQVGKTLGTDFQNRKPTLPVIHSLEVGSVTHRDALLALLNADTCDGEQILKLLNVTESIEYARTVGRQCIEKSVSFANSLPKNDFSRALQNLSAFVLQRTF